MALRLLHFADLHLDRSFARERLSGPAASRCRQDLRQALTRIVERAATAGCDLITCGGDLFDQETVTRETADFVAELLGKAGRPVLLVPGHSDPPDAGSVYRWAAWPDNVTVVLHEELRPYAYGGVTFWAAGFLGASPPASALSRFRPAAGRNVLLLHASDMSRLPEATAPWAPIVPSQLQEAGFAHALLGHYHVACTSSALTYPGSPEPLGWNDTGPHCVALVTVPEEGPAAVSLERFNHREFVRETLDITGISQSEIKAALLNMRASKHLDQAIVRMVFTGQRARRAGLDLETLGAECADAFAHLELVDRSRHPHDLDALSREFTTRGETIRRLQARRAEGEPDAVVTRAVEMVADAFDE